MLTTNHPGADTSIDVRGLMSSVQHIDGDVVLVLTADDVRIQVEPGLGGTYLQAVLGAERLADAAEHFAALLRVRAGQRTAFTPASGPRSA
jgi:hypothetical protein